MASRSVSSGARRSATPRRGKGHSLVPEDARAYRALAASWLRYTRNCTLVCFERSPWNTKELPDVLGLDSSRRSIEIEIKVSKSDFLHDAEKPHRKTLLLRIMGKMTTAPQELWYLVPRWLAPVVLTSGPEYAGVLVPSDTVFDTFSGFPSLEVLRPALRLHSYKLPIPQVFVMAKDMAGTLTSVLRDYVKLMGTSIGNALVIDPSKSHPMDQVPYVKLTTTEMMQRQEESVNEPPGFSPLADQPEVSSNVSVRKTWTSIGRQSTSRSNPTTRKSRES